MAKNKKEDAGQKAATPTIQWDDSDMSTSYANVCNVSSSREEVTLLFGTNQTWHTGQSEFTVKLSDRVIISPFAGSLIGGAVHWAVGLRRGRNTWWIVAVCIVAGALVTLVARATNLLAAGIYAFTATAASIGILRLGRSR